MNMKTFVLALFFMLWQDLRAQLFRSTEGYISFFSVAPLENIEAGSKNIVSVLNPESNEIAFSVSVNSFQFKKQKMQDDFNEDFMESGKYPMATYKGKIQEQIDWKKEGSYTITSVGTLTVHGQSKDRKDTATITISQNEIRMNSQFKVTVSDHGIRIPKIFFENIAEAVSVKLMMTYMPLEEPKKQ